MGPFARRPVRLFASAGRLSRRPGRISARSLRRCRPDQGAGRAERRAGAVPVRHLPDRLHGRRILQHQRRRHDRRSGAAARSAQFAIRSAFLLGAERVIAIDTVPERLRMARDAGADHDRFHEGGRLRPHPGADRRAAARTPASTRSAPSRTRTASFDSDARPRQGRDLHGHRPAARAAPGDPLLPQLRHRLDRRRLWRLPRQDPDGLGDQSRPDLPHGADAGAALPAEAAGAHREGRDRSVLRHHPPGAARGRARNSTRHSATRRTAASRS